MSSTTNYMWDEENRLVSVTIPGGSESYEYSGNDLRHSKTTGGQTTRFLWDEENLLQEKSDDATVAQYTNAPDGYGPLLSQRRNDGNPSSDAGAQLNTFAFGSAVFNQDSSGSSGLTSSFYGFDLSGNTRLLTDESGTVSDRYVSTAFGKEVSATGSTPNPYQFGGEVGYYRDDAERSYVRARYLSRSRGRWISRDPIEFEGGDWNLYRYVGNNPNQWVDPSGLQSGPTPSPCPTPPPSNECQAAMKAKLSACGPGPSTPQYSCTKSDFKLIERRVKKSGAKHVICAEIRKRIRLGQKCLLARYVVTESCYKGVQDDRHFKEETDTYNSIANCYAKYAEHKCGSRRRVPIRRPAPVPVPVPNPTWEAAKKTARDLLAAGVAAAAVAAWLAQVAAALRRGGAIPPPPRPA